MCDCVFIYIYIYDRFIRGLKHREIILLFIILIKDKYGYEWRKFFGLCGFVLIKQISFIYLFMIKFPGI